MGDGPERDRLIGGARRAGALAGNAVLTGHLSDPDHVHDALRGADLVVLLSAAEGLPQVLVQSAAAGTPFVAFDVEGVRELLSLGARGSAVPPGRLDTAAAAAAEWLTAGRPPAASRSRTCPAGPRRRSTRPTGPRSRARSGSSGPRRRADRISVSA